jgi:hypothetical protein
MYDDCTQNGEDWHRCVRWGETVEQHAIDLEFRGTVVQLPEELGDVDMDEPVREFPPFAVEASSSNAEDVDVVKVIKKMGEAPWARVVLDDCEDRNACGWWKSVMREIFCE